MDTTKQNPLQGAEESDDLIAELARLVARDARSQSANSAAYSPEPEPEPQLPADDYAEPERDETGYDAYAEAADDAAMTSRPEPAFDFDFNFAGNADAPAPMADQHDEIAELIASAEEDERPAQEEDDEFPGYAVEPVIAPEISVSDAPPRSEPHSPPEEIYAHPTAPRQTEDRDPLSEIEALIGEAVQVSANGAANSGRKVRSSYLDTPDYQDIRAEHAVDAAESAILAAAAASGARVSHIEEPVRPEPEPEVEPAIAPSFDPADFRQDDPDAAGAEIGAEPVEADEVPVRRPRRRGGYVLPAVAGTAIVALLGAGYFFFLAPPPVPGEAPVLVADTGDLKAVPEDTGTPSTASESVIFNEIDGNTVSPEDEALVSRDQTDGATGAEIGSVIAPEEGETALANRPVRTVTVRPDGTIVSSDNSIAGSNVLPVDRPDVPSVPNSTLTADPIGEAIAAAIADEPVGAQSPTPTEVAATPAQAPAETAAAIVDPELIPRPVARPSGLTSSQAAPQPVQPAPQTIETAAAQPLAVPTPAPAATTAAPGNVGAWVQLSSQRSEEAAQADIPSLQSRYGALFNGTALDVSRVDLGERGIYYRVRLPQPSMAEANTVCDAIKGQGGDCFVLNN